MLRTIRSLCIVSCLVVLLSPASLVAAEPVKKGDFLGAQPVEIPAWFKSSFLNMKEDIDEATAAGKRVMLYFHQNSCPYCAKLVNENFTDKRIVDYLAKHFDSLDINMWGDREVIDMNGKPYNEKSFSATQKVWFTPTILFFDETGKVALRVNGYYPIDKFMTALQYVAEKKETQLSFAEYAKQTATVRKPGKLTRESFFVQPGYNLHKLQHAKKPLAILFEEGDCDACNNLHNISLKDKDTVEILKQFNIVQLDRWADTPLIDLNGNPTTAKKLAETLKISYAPSAVLYDKGKEVIRIEAFLKSFHVQSVFDYVLSGSYKTETSFQRYIEHRADEIRKTGKTVDIWK